MTVVELHVHGPGLGDGWPAQRMRAHADTEEEAVDAVMQRALDNDLFCADSLDDLEVESREVLEE